jgi:HK97 family phage major capsid protein
MSIALTAPEQGLHLRPAHRAQLVAELQKRVKQPMPAAQRAPAPVATRLSPREALIQRDALPPELTTGQKMSASAAWLMESFEQHQIALRLWDKGAPMLPMTKAANESIDSQGAAIVPSETAAFIIANRDRAVFRSNSTVYQIASDTLTVPRKTGAVSTAFVGEGALIPQTQPVFDGVGFTAQKLVAHGTFSTEVQEDSAANITSYFLADAGSALALREDDCAKMTADSTVTIRLHSQG